jgi:hypothetical protein
MFDDRKPAMACASYRRKTLCGACQEYSYTGRFYPACAVRETCPCGALQRVVRKLAQAGKKIVKLAGLIHHRERHVRGAGPLGLLMGIMQRWGMKSPWRS